MNGVSLTEIMRKKKTLLAKKTPIRKTGAKDKKKSVKIATRPIANIRNYMVVNKQDNKKATFRTIGAVSILTKIR